MNQTESSPLNLLEQLVSSRVMERLHTLKHLDYGEAISWLDPQDELEEVVICSRCDVTALEREYALDPDYFSIEYPAKLPHAQTCELCDRPVKYLMRPAGRRRFLEWTLRLCDAESAVPVDYWISALAALESSAEEDKTTVEYELFLHAVLDLDLLQP